MRLVVLVALLAGIGCGADARPTFVTEDGLPVYVESNAEWLNRPDTPERVSAAVRHSVAFWNGSPRALVFWELAFQDGLIFDCVPGVTLGCADFANRRMTVSTAGSNDGLPLPLTCIEASLLAHEIGHAIIGDPGHESPRWQELLNWQSAWVDVVADCTH